MAVNEYDQQNLSASQQAQIQGLTDQWNKLEEQHVALREQETALRNSGDTAGADAIRSQINGIKQQKSDLNTQAEAIRATKGYLSGQQGMDYIPIAKEEKQTTTTPVASPGIISGVTAPDTVAGTNVSGVTPAQPNYSAEELMAKWRENMPQVDPDATVDKLMQGVTDPTTAKNEQIDLLEQWKQEVIAKNNGLIDYNVAKAITELERALQDAQPQYKEQQESIAKDERQALDNSALYAEARGDKGGIGQEQYNSIMNTAAQNRLTVQKAQTKLATDTQRQIADLRAQGEFDKADAALEVSQQYLSQLMSIEQWALDYGLTTAQFQASLEQWAADYKMAMAQFTTGLEQWAADYDFNLAQYKTNNDQWNKSFLLGQEQWNKNFALNQQQFNTSVEQWNKEFQLGQNQWNANFQYAQQQDGVSNDMSWSQILGTVPSTGQQTLAYQQYLQNQQLNQQTTLAQQGLDMAKMGLSPSSLQLAAMKSVYGYEQAQVDSIISAAKLAAQSGAGAGTGGNGVSVKDMSADQIYDYLFQRGYTPETSEDVIVGDLMAQGLSENAAKRHYKAFADTKYNDVYDDYAAESIPAEYREWLKNNFPDGVIDGEGRWESWAEKFGEEALLAAGYGPEKALSFARYLYNSTKNADYVYQTLKSSGYSDIMIDYLMAKLGL